MFWFNCVAFSLSQISLSEDIELRKQGVVVAEAIPTTIGVFIGNTTVTAADSTLSD